MDREQIPYGSDDKLEAGSLTTQSRALKWLDNYWYHYKWHTIIFSFFAVVLIIGLVQMFNRPSYDTMLVCAGGAALTEEEQIAFSEMLDKVCPEDFNQDDEKKVNFVMYQAYSNEELQAEKEVVEASGDRFVYDGNHYAQESKNFIFFTQTGEGAVCLISPYLYANLTIEERLRDVIEMYPEGDIPQGITEDGNGVIWGETDLYTYHPAARVIPKTWILCLLKKTINADDTDYSRSEQFFTALIDYQVVTP